MQGEDEKRKYSPYQWGIYTAVREISWRYVFDALFFFAFPNQLLLKSYRHSVIELILSCLHPFLLTFKISDFLDIQGTSSIESQSAFSVLFPLSSHMQSTQTLSRTWGVGQSEGGLFFYCFPSSTNLQSLSQNGALSEVSLPSLPLNSVVCTALADLAGSAFVRCVFLYDVPPLSKSRCLPFASFESSGFPCRVLKPVAPRSRSHRLFIHRAGGLPVDIPTLEVLPSWFRIASLMSHNLSSKLSCNSN